MSYKEDANSKISNGVKKSPSTIGLVFSAFVLFFLFAPASPVKAAGASLFFTPSAGTFGLNSTFSISVKVNCGDESINAIEGNLNFDADKLEVVSIGRSNSIFSLWPVGPNFSNQQGTINFGGGLIHPGYSGASGNIINIIFRAKAVGNAQIVISSGSVLANDGKGTNVLTTIGSANLTISPESSMPASGINGDAGGTSAPKPEETVFETVDIALGPDQGFWYRNNNLLIRWDTLSSSTEVSFAFDKNPDSIPGTKGVMLKSQEFKDIEDGIWYFHIRYKEGKAWTETFHHKIQIDTTPPEPFKVEVKSDSLNQWPVLDFRTSDDVSGIAKYEIHIDSFTTREETLGPDQTSLITSGLEVGEHTALVRAVDKAGNEAYSTVSFNIKPIDTPVIRNYSDEIKTSGRFFISGTSIPDATIIVYTSKGGDSKVTQGRTQSDKSGNWYFVDETSRPNGTYVAWVEAENANGIKSAQSDKVSFIVSPPIFARIGDFVVNYFTVVVSLIFMIILTVASAIYLGEMIRKKLKKETVEVEDVLRENLENLQKDIDNELSKLGKYKGTNEFTREKIKTKNLLDDKVRSTEEKIMKEVKDVEKILK